MLQLFWFFWGVIYHHNFEQKCNFDRRLILWAGYFPCLIVCSCMRLNNGLWSILRYLLLLLLRCLRAARQRERGAMPSASYALLEPQLAELIKHSLFLLCCLSSATPLGKPQRNCKLCSLSTRLALESIIPSPARQPGRQLGATAGLLVRVACRNITHPKLSFPSPSSNVSPALWGAIKSKILTYHSGWCEKKKRGILRSKNELELPVSKRHFFPYTLLV